MEPWGRQPGEPAKAFFAFTLYRDMGYKRSLVKVGQKYSGGRTVKALMERWSSKFNWVKRAQAYDDHLDTLHVKKSERQLKGMNRRHITLSRKLQRKAAKKLNILDGTEMTVYEAIKAIAEGAKLERLTRGEATEKIDALVTTPTPMEWEQIPEVAEAVAKIRAKLLKEKEAADKEATESEQPP